MWPVSCMKMVPSKSTGSKLVGAHTGQAFESWAIEDDREGNRTGEADDLSSLGSPGENSIDVLDLDWWWGDSNRHVDGCW